MKHYVAYALTLFVGVIITWGMLSPSDGGQPPFAHFDKVMHVMAFACLGFPLTATRTHPSRRIFVAGLAFGAVIELFQPHFGRTGDWIDLLADMAGLCLGIAFGRLAARVTGR